jgi:hypothetical protein
MVELDTDACLAFFFIIVTAGLHFFQLDLFALSIKYFIDFKENTDCCEVEISRDFLSYVKERVFFLVLVAFFFA